MHQSLSKTKNSCGFVGGRYANYDGENLIGHINNHELTAIDLDVLRIKKIMLECLPSTLDYLNIDDTVYNRT